MAIINTFGEYKTQGLLERGLSGLSQDLQCKNDAKKIYIH